jgi:hypothetical protein
MAFFEPLRKVANVFIKLDANDIVFKVIGSDKQIQEEILDLNRLNQLFKKGEDSLGTNLNSMTQSGFGYAASTKRDKRRKNLPTGHVTLFDTGDFYKSFRLIVRPTYLDITANPNKEDSNLFDDFGDDIVGLSEESKDLLRLKLIPLIINHIRLQL